MLTLSLRERDKLTVLRQVEEGLITPCTGARKLAISSRQFRRLRKRFLTSGDAAVIHGLRGRPSNHRLDPELRSQALKRALDPVYHDFAPTLLSEHLSRAIGKEISSSTLRSWMIAEGLWLASERKLQHRSHRARRFAFGELVQMDTSIHDWFEGRSLSEPVLIAMIDDATSRLFARFAPTDSGAANRGVLIQYIRRYGRMGSLYADRAAHFQSRRTKRELSEDPPMSSLIKHGLDELGIELISALSPQAKGRVERLFNTLQDRLLKEMRVASISTIEAANEFLEKSFIPFWNSRFSVKPQIPEDFHRPVPEGTDLIEIFAEPHRRLIRADYTVRFQNTFYQIPKKLATASMPGTNLTVLRRIDGKLTFKWGHLTLELNALPGLPESAAVLAKPRVPPKPRSQQNHPWRKTNWIFAVKD